MDRPEDSNIILRPKAAAVPIYPLKEVYSVSDTVSVKSEIRRPKGAVAKKQPSGLKILTLLVVLDL